MRHIPQHQKPTFELPAKAVGEAMAAFRAATGGQMLTTHHYTVSAQALLAALVEQGWTITPPRDVASQQR